MNYTVDDYVAHYNLYVVFNIVNILGDIHEASLESNEISN